MVSLVSARSARRIATAAAFGGGGLGVLGASVYGLLRAQAVLARRSITGRPLGGPPDPDAVYGDFDGPPLSFVVIGDSTATGYGVAHPDETPGALLAAGLAEVAERPVRLTTVAKVGARSSDLAAQVDQALLAEPGLALVIIGGNDVTHRMPQADSAALLSTEVRRLRVHGAEVVVGTCPDLGTIKPLRQPLRWLARRWSRQLAAAQTVAVVEAGGRTVSVAAILGPEFEAAPVELFAEDRFHPSAAGYAHAAAAILPALAEALSLWDDDERLDATPGDDVLPVSVAAATAAGEDGTEVAAASVRGRDRGPRGRWALLRHRPTAASDETRASSGTEPEYESTGEATTVTVTRE